jgi:hypothetical protein
VKNITTFLLTAGPSFTENCYVTNLASVLLIGNEFDHKLLKWGRQKDREVV